jgi:ABC-2 type transport system permease protein
VPTTSEFLQAVEAERAQRKPKGWADPLIQAELTKHGVTRREDLPFDVGGFLLVEGDKIDSAVYETQFRNLAGLYQRQDRYVQLGGAVAPFLALQSMVMSLAGTDLHHHWDFAFAVERYRREWLHILNEDLLLHRKPNQLYGYTRGPELWEQVPPMRYVPPSWTWALASQHVAVATLAGWLMFSSLMLVTAARRWSVG